MAAVLWPSPARPPLETRLSNGRLRGLSTATQRVDNDPVDAPFMCAGEARAPNFARAVATESSDTVLYM